MRKLVKNRDKVPNISAECLHALEIVSKYYNEDYNEDKQSRLADEVTQYIQEDFNSRAKILLELDEHRMKMTKALAHEQKEIIEVNEGFMPVFVSAESFDDEPILMECVDMLLSIEPSFEEDFEELYKGLCFKKADIDTKEFERYKKLLS